MISSFPVLVHATLVILFVALGPVVAYSQEQSEPAVAEQSEPAVEKQVPDVQPQSQEGTQEETAAPQPGSLVVPRTDEPASEEPENSTVQKPDADGTYIIRKGDTLWDISNAFLKDPFLWPFIWKANPYIANADLIYPGDRLVIPDLAPIEQAIHAPAGEEKAAAPTAGQTTAEEEQTPVSTLVLPEESPVPIIDKYSMLSAGFVSSEESKDVIVGSPEGKTIMGYDDLVYVAIVSKTNASIGDRFLIYRPYNNVKHPVTGKRFGRLIRVLGVLQLTEAGKSNTYKARITLSFDSIDRGSMLTPYQEPALIYNTAAKVKDISGYILEVVDTRTINGQVDIVYLDRGTADGVEPGDRFQVYVKAKKNAYPKILIGEAQVFLVKERTSTAIVRKSMDALAKGNMIEFKK